MPEGEPKIGFWQKIFGRKEKEPKKDVNQSVVQEASLEILDKEKPVGEATELDKKAQEYFQQKKEIGSEEPPAKELSEEEKKSLDAAKHFIEVAQKQEKKPGETPAHQEPIEKQDLQKQELASIEFQAAKLQKLINDEISKIKEDPGLDEIEKNYQINLLLDEYYKEQDKLYAKVKIKEVFNLKNPEDIITFVLTTSPEQKRAKDLEQEYGKGCWGQFKALLAGEYDFSITKNGEIKRNNWKEFSRKALTTVFNRRTALQVGTGAVITTFTGGVGIGSSISTIVGTWAGRGGFEAWESLYGKEGKMRREMAKEGVTGWLELKLKFREIHDPRLSQEEKNNKIAQALESYFAIDNKALSKKEEFAKIKQETDEMREKWSKAGALAGLGTYFFVGFTGLKELFTKMDIDGDKVYHKLEDVWKTLLGQEKLKYVVENAQAGWGKEDLIQGVSKAEHYTRTAAGEHAHVLVEKGKGVSEYFWGLGKNIVRDFGVLAATYLAGTKFVRAPQFFAGKPLEEQKKEHAQAKEKTLEPLIKEKEEAKRAKEERAKTPYGQAQIGDQWRLDFDGELYRFKVIDKYLDKESGKERIKFKDIDKTGVVKNNQDKVLDEFDYSQEDFNKTYGTAGKWEHPGYTPQERQVFEDHNENKMLDEIKQGYTVKFLSKKAMPEALNQDAQYAVYKIDQDKNRILIYDKELGRTEKGTKSLKLTDLLKVIAGFEKEPAKEKKEEKPADSGEEKIPRKKADAEDSKKEGQKTKESKSEKPKEETKKPEKEIKPEGQKEKPEAKPEKKFEIGEQVKFRIKKKEGEEQEFQGKVTGFSKDNKDRDRVNIDVTNPDGSTKKSMILRDFVEKIPAA